jgi:hypothetical protein
VHARHTAAKTLDLLKKLGPLLEKFPAMSGAIGNPDFQSLKGVRQPSSDQGLAATAAGIRVRFGNFSEMPGFRLRNPRAIR